MTYDKPYTPRPNTGSLFANKEKKTPQAPDYRGDLLVDVSSLEVVNGVAKIKLSGWKKTSAKGTVYLSIAVDTFKPRHEQLRQSKSLADADDDLPF